MVSLMAAETSAVSIARLWVIEALASCEQVDASLLKDLVGSTPELSDDFGKNTREVVSLRCLEDLFGPSNGITNEVSPGPDFKIGFDLSENCEDVLKRILHEMPTSALSVAGPELLKWDIHPFIMHKRSSLPKCALEQLKDTIHECTHPFATFLKERSVLAIRTECEYKNPVGDGDLIALSQMFGGNGNDHQIKAASGKLSALTSENGNGLLQEESPNRIVLPSKRSRSDSANENLAGEFHELCMENVGDLHLNAKKANQGSSSTVQSVGQDLVPAHRSEQLDGSSGRTIVDTEREGRNLAKESLVGGLEGGRVSEGVHNEYVSRERTEKTDVTDDDVQPNQLQSCNNNKFPQRTAGDSPCQNTSVDGTKGDTNCCVELKTSNSATPNPTQHKISIDVAKNNSENSFQPKTSISAFPDGSNPKILGNGAEDNKKHYCEEETWNDSDGSEDEHNDVATRKHSFLSSQSAYNQDSLSTTVWTEQNLCMKCDKDGQLLVCSSNGCPLVVHNNCLGSEARFDNNGNFYCPFCAHSLAIREYLETKKKVSLTRKELAAFIGVGNKYQTEKHSKRFSHKKEQNGDANLLVKSYGNGSLREDGNRQAGDDGELANQNKEEEDRRAVHNGQHVNQVNNQQIRESIDDKRQAEPSVPCVTDNLSCREEEATAICRAPSVFAKEKQGGKMVKEQQSIRGVEQQHNEVPAGGEYEDDNPFAEYFFVSRREPKVGIQQDDLQQQVTDPPQEPSCEPSIDSEAISEDEMDESEEKSIVPQYTIRLRRQAKRYTYPAIPLSRRKKIAWTAEEEEILKEGVRRFSRVGDRNIPWKQIWEFGSAVFQRCRTPGDLKDKWRNICKGSPPKSK